MLLDENARGRVSGVSSSRTGTADCRTIGSRIQVAIHEMHGRAADLHTMSKRLTLRVDPRKGRQQRRVNVQNRVGECVKEPLTDQAHEPGEAHEPNATGLEFSRQRHVERITISELTMVERQGLDARTARPIEAGRAIAVRNHDGNPRAQEPVSMASIKA